MLSEGYMLRRNLDATAFEIPERHPDIRSPGKAAGYRVGIDERGLPADVEALDPQTMGSLWTHREAQQNSFPVVKVQHALLAVPADDPLREQLQSLKKQENAQRIELLRKSINGRSFRLPTRDEQMWLRVREKAGALLQVFADQDQRFAALPTTLRRFAESGASPAQLLKLVGELIVNRLEQGRLSDATLAEKLLIGKPDARKPDSPAKAEVPVVLDVAEANFPVRVADPRMERHVHRCLLRSISKEPDESAGVCAMSGQTQLLVKKAFPEPNLGPIGQVKLFVRNRDAPCETRYGMTSADSMPVGRQVAGAIADGLKAITGKDLRGKTWQMVANGKWEGSGKNKTEKRDLLIVYVEGQPVLDAQIADMFGNDEKERQSQFEADSATVCKALEGVLKHRPDSRLQLVMLGKADKEKKQVMLHLSPTVREVLDAADGWRRAVRENLPLLTLPLPPGKKGQKAVQARPLPPYPDRVVRLLAGQWIREGSEEQKVEGVALRAVLDLMLRTSGKWHETAQHMLELTLQRVGLLLLGVTSALRSSDVKRLNRYSPSSRETALRAVAVLGILLDALGRQKEVYMNEIAFQLGRLLSLADTLHREYCVHVRGGNIPPKLIGNALMPAAADNPQDAVDRLRERLNIYQAWAMKGDSEEYRLAKWAVGQMGEACHAISQLSIPTSTNQAFRAELFLGYMARSPKGDSQKTKEDFNEQ